MLSLHPTDYFIVSKWFREFQKKARSLEMPPDDCTVVGIYSDSILVGYYILVGSPEEGILEINQGFLTKEARHKGFSYQAMNLLETKAKEVGYKRIVLKASRSLKAYHKFMSDLGYSPESVIFSKEVK